MNFLMVRYHGRKQLVSSSTNNSWNPRDTAYKQAYWFTTYVASPFHWTLLKYPKDLYFYENAFENVVLEMVAILVQGRFFNVTYLQPHKIRICFIIFQGLKSIVNLQVFD